MTDKEYIHLMTRLVDSLNRLDPHSVFANLERDKIIRCIRELNFTWCCERSFRHWHYLLKLLLLLTFVTFVIFMIVF